MAPKAVLHSNKKKKKEVIEKPIEKTKKMKRKNYQSFSMYLFKILRSLTKDATGIKRQSMMIINNIVNDMLQKLALEASRLVRYSKKNTLGRREIYTATKLLVPGELAKHANIEAMKAIAKYHNSIEKDAKGTQ